jgi:hypothetical protein
VVGCVGLSEALTVTVMVAVGGGLVVGVRAPEHAVRAKKLAVAPMRTVLQES